MASRSGAGGGLGGVADRLRASLARSIGLGLRGERRALVEGIVLGDDQELPTNLRDRFRASGLYHLLAVSGGERGARRRRGCSSWRGLVGVPRWLGELGALAAIAAYVLAVGAQPSVVRAGISGSLGSLAWLAARERDRWHFLLLGAFAVLAWNPYTLFDPGFQLSFAAVIAIFVLTPRLARRLEGYPLPHVACGRVLAVSIACAAGDGADRLAPASRCRCWRFRPTRWRLPRWARCSRSRSPVRGRRAGSRRAPAALAWLDGWCAAYIAVCARLIGGLPFAQVRSGTVLALVCGWAVLVAAYALRR